LGKDEWARCTEDLGIAGLPLGRAPVRAGSAA